MKAVPIIITAYLVFVGTELVAFNILGISTELWKSLAIGGVITGISIIIPNWKGAFEWTRSASAPSSTDGKNSTAR